MIDQFERLAANNPWWGSPKLIEEDSLLLEFAQQKYRYLHPLINSFPLDKDAVLTVRGPRRVGKSTLVRLIIKRLLLTEKRAKEAVFFFPCDRLRDFDELFELIKEYLDFARPRSKSRLFLFLDEISFVSDWQRAVKELVDAGLLRNATVLLTGSSILDLKYGSEYLAGRRGQVFPSDIFYYPLSFADFVDLVAPQIKREESILELFQQLPKLKKLFSDYLVTGGFPKTINEFYNLGRIEQSTYETFLTWIENDIHKTKRNEQTAYDLVENIIRTITTPVSFTSLARDCNLSSHVAVQEYIDILEKMFILFPLEAFVVEERRRNIKKNKKMYFTDPFIFDALHLKTSQQMEDPFRESQRIAAPSFMPKLAEMNVAFHLKRIYSQLFWGKTAQGEIDFAVKNRGKLYFYEVKYQEKIDYGEITRRENFTLISKKTLRDKPIQTLPLEIFLVKIYK